MTRIKTSVGKRNRIQQDFVSRTEKQNTEQSNEKPNQCFSMFHQRQSKRYFKAWFPHDRLESLGIAGSLDHRIIFLDSCSKIVVGR